MSHRTVLLVLLASVLCWNAGCTPGTDPGVPEEVIRHNILGTAHLGQTKWADAESEFRRALELRPEDPLLLTNAAIALNQQENADEALVLLERAATVDPTYVSAHFNMGLIESRRGDFERAAIHFEKAAALDAEDLFIRYYLGTSMARIGRESEAIDSLRAALDRDPTHVSTLYALGRLLLQQGEQDEGMKMITRSQEIRARSGLDEAVGSEYGEQGRLSRAADYPGGALVAPEAIDVRLEQRDRVKLERADGAVAFALIPANEAVALLVAAGSMVQQPFPGDHPGSLAHSPVDGATISDLEAADLDNDANIDLAMLLTIETPREGHTLVPAWSRRDEGGQFVRPRPTEESFSGTVATPVDSADHGCDLTVVDRDHDGDLDLFWCCPGTAETAGGCKLATNDGEGRFDVKSSTEHGFDFPSRAGGVQVAFSDVDNDRDVDLLAADTTRVQLFSNQRDGSFEEIGEAVGLGSAVSGVKSFVVTDLNKDGWMDLLVAGTGGLRLLENRHGRFEPPVALGGDVAAADDAVVLDFDNDGFLDVVASSPSGLSVRHNRGAGGWQTRSDLLRVEGAGDSLRPLAPLDVDGDGDLDLVAADGSDAVVLLVNQGGNSNRWIALDSQGIGDNHFGIGAKVEVLAGALRQKFEITRPLPLHVGLGSRERVQAARYLWPGGVLQDEIGLDAGGVKAVVQLDRKGTSCPLLYAWRDGRWHFVTDFLGGAAVGYQRAPGVFSVPDTDEYVRIEGGLVEDREGRLRLRLNNQLEEVIWFDAVDLVVVEHPEGTEVYPNERLMPGPPWPEFKLFASADVRPIASARGLEDDSDLTSRLRERDRSFVDNFRSLRPKGYAEHHTLELDLGGFARDDRVVLLLDGWIDYADSSANVAASQAGLELVPPRLHVADGRGGWTDVSDDLMGFPAGLPKTMAVELTGLFPSPDHRVRIATNMRIYWDRARVMIGGEDTSLEVTRLRPERAELGFGGFPRRTSPDGRKPFAYAPDDVAPTQSWKAHVGEYTGFGDVTRLLADVDDRFVTTRNGDQIELSFRSPGRVRQGYVRTYLLFADGFGKDMDPNSAAADAIGPVPFHDMPSYPYPGDVSPPHAQDAGGTGSRRVARSAAGWPGAEPLGAHAAR